MVQRGSKEGIGRESVVPVFAPGDSPFHAKGMLWMGMRAFMSAQVPGGVDAVCAELPKPLSEFLTQMFLPTAYYDLMPVLPVVQAASAALRLDTLEYVKRSAVWHAEQDMNGVYRAMLLMDSPVAVCRRFGSIHSQIYDFGKAQMLREEANRVESLATGMPEPLAWWWKRASEHYVLTVLRAAGAKNPRMHWQPNQPDGARSGVPLVRLPSYTTWT
jgi:hypothetical protein